MNLRELPKTVSAGEELEVQLAPLGDWAQTVGGKRVTQHFDADACSKVVGNFSRELLVDADHRSTRPDGDTAAYAWVTALRADPELGLVGTMRFTDKGASAVNGREYRFVSVAWYIGDDGRPYELDSVALTNRPNLPVRPVVNREGGGSTAAEGGETQRNPAMEELKKLLGLAAEATDEEILSAAKALKARCDELEAASKDAEAEQFAAENASKASREALKNAYLASPEAARALVAGIAEPEKPQKVLNAAEAKKPELATASKEALAALPPADRAKYYREHAAEIDG